VFKLERQVVRLQDSQGMEEVVYGVTSLTANEAGPEQILDFVRGQGGIENGLHYRRDATLREDGCCVRIGCAPQRLTLINNSNDNVTQPVLLSRVSFVCSKCHTRFPGVALGRAKSCSIAS
jgi:hypothetical protein